MEIKDFSNSDLESQIELHEDRIETVREYISDTDDSSTRSAMREQLQRYQMTLQALKQERQRRVAQPVKDAFTDFGNYLFISSDHLRYENGVHVSGPHGGARRAVKVEPNISDGEGYSVTLYNLDGDHPIWQNNVQMAPKQMKVVEKSSDIIVLRGYGRDATGASFADYGLTTYLQNGVVQKCILHMHDRGIDIEYLA